MRILIIPIILLLLISCTKDEKNIEIKTNFNNGVFVVNEGNYNWQNSSISYIDFDSNKVYNKLFYSVNNKSLGDVAQSLYVIDSMIFIIVNNSGKIEVVSKNTFKSIATIEGLTSPRYMIEISKEEALVSDLYSKYISVINYKSFTVTGSIYLGKSSEKMVKYNNKVFVTNWSGIGMQEIDNNTVQVIDIVSKQVIDSIVVSKEPCSAGLDINDNLWILCSGGFQNDEFPGLYKINPDDHSIISKFDFPQNTTPKHLKFNNQKNVMYYVNNSIYKISVDAVELPENAYITGENTNFYNITVLPNSDILTTDALDYVQPGYVSYYNNNILVDTFKVQIVPSGMLYVNSDR